MKPLLLLSSLAILCLWENGFGNVAARADLPWRILEIQDQDRWISDIGTVDVPTIFHSPSPWEVAQETWQSYSRPQGGFTVQMPSGTVRESIQPTATELGDIEIHLLGIDLPTRLYVVFYHDFPDVFQNASPEELLSAQLQGVLGNVSRRLEENQPITLAGYPGINLYYEGFDGITYKQRLYIVNQRLYMLVAATSEVVGTGFLEDADRFFNSFELTLASP